MRLTHVQHSDSADIQCKRRLFWWDILVSDIPNSPLVRRVVLGLGLRALGDDECFCMQLVGTWPVGRIGDPACGMSLSVEFQIGEVRLTLVYESLRT